MLDSFKGFSLIMWRCNSGLCLPFISPLIECDLEIFFIPLSAIIHINKFYLITLFFKLVYLNLFEKFKVFAGKEQNIMGSIYLKYKYKFDIFIPTLLKYNEKYCDDVWFRFLKAFG